MGIFKKKIQGRSKKGLRKAEKEGVDRNPSQGLDGTPMSEPIPLFNRTDGEKVYKNKNNSWIVLGRDRPSGKPSGYGGAGNDKCAAIDLVVGRLAATPSADKTDIFVDPSFETDAARIYISQKTDIDKNFAIARGNVGISTGRSAIGLKADSIRIMARQGIKIISSMPGDIAALQGEPGTKSRYGIDLLAGNSDAEGFLQPIPKGNNLQEALNKIINSIEDTNKIINTFVSTQMTFNTQVAAHVHPLGFPVTSPAPTLLAAHAQCMPQQIINCRIPAGWKQRVNLSIIRNNYLKSGSPKWINSKLNRTT